MPVVFALALSLALFMGVFYWLKPTTATEVYTREEIIKSLEEMYQGMVTDSRVDGEYYNIELETKSGTYQIKVDSVSGKIHTLSLLEAKQQELPDETDDSNKQSDNVNVLSKAEIESLIQKHTHGIIEKVELVEVPEGAYYSAVIIQDTYKISLKLDQKTGEVLSETKEKLEEQIVYLTEQEAISIAQNYLSGEIDSIQFYQDTKTPYYLVEIEDDDQEAVIQIHGVSGKILSVSWDDYEDENELDEDDNDD